VINFETGQRLMQDAERHYIQMLDAYKNEWWNIVIRRAQETVELSLKAILKILGIEYSKVHDVAPIFVESLRKRGIDLAEFEEIKKISAKLSEERAPSFYEEKIYDKIDAEAALKGAKNIKGSTKKNKGRK
jgi:HEPN domain-containing protein